MISADQQTSGKVIDLQQVTQTDNLLGHGYRWKTLIISIPAVEYTVNKTTYRLNGSSFNAYLLLKKNKYVIGQTVPVLYDKQNPNHAYINDVYELWAMPLLCLLLGLSLLIFISFLIKVIINLIEKI